MTDPVSRLGEIRARFRDAEELRGRASRADVGWLLEHIEQLQQSMQAQRAAINQLQELQPTVQMPSVRACKIHGESFRIVEAERDGLQAQRQAVLGLLNKHIDDIDLFVAVQIRAALGADDDR